MFKNYSSAISWTKKIYPHKKINPPAKEFCGPHQKQIFETEKKKWISSQYVYFFHGNVDTVRLGQEIQCLP